VYETEADFVLSTKLVVEAEGRKEGRKEGRTSVTDVRRTGEWVAALPAHPHEDTLA